MSGAACFVLFDQETCGKGEGAADRRVDRPGHEQTCRTYLGRRGQVEQDQYPKREHRDTGCIILRKGQLPKKRRCNRKAHGDLALPGASRRDGMEIGHDDSGHRAEKTLCCPQCVGAAAGLHDDECRDRHPIGFDVRDEKAERQAADGCSTAKCDKTRILISDDLARGGETDAANIWLNPMFAVGAEDRQDRAARDTKRRRRTELRQIGADDHANERIARDQFHAGHRALDKARETRESKCGKHYDRLDPATSPPKAPADAKHNAAIANTQSRSRTGPS